MRLCVCVCVCMYVMVAVTGDVVRMVAVAEAAARVITFISRHARIVKS